MATIQPVSLAFENDEAARALQDIGLDGLNDAEERDHFRAYLDSVRTYAGTQAYNRIASDPSGDNFHHYKGEDLDQRNAGILERYKKHLGRERGKLPAG
jgi:cell surface protein SprA